MELYRTSNKYLIAYLIEQGLKQVEVESENPRSITFCFKADEAEQEVLAYLQGAKVEAKSYASSLDIVAGIIKRESNK